MSRFAGGGSLSGEPSRKPHPAGTDATVLSQLCKLIPPPLVARIRPGTAPSPGPGGTTMETIPAKGLNPSVEQRELFVAVEYLSSDRLRVAMSPPFPRPPARPPALSTAFTGKAISGQSIRGRNQSGPTRWQNHTRRKLRRPAQSSSNLIPDGGVGRAGLAPKVKLSATLHPSTFAS